jgi:subtilisin family serine protease
LLVLALAGAVGALAGAPAAYADSVRDAEWHLRYLHVEEAQQHATGDGVVVAVLDSGVDASHPDLTGSVLPGRSAVGADELARFDADGRGTALAGLIAAHGHGTGNADGVMGVAPRAKVLPVVVTGGAATGGPSTPAGPAADDPDAVARGIQVALQNGAKVICVGRSVPASGQLHDAVEAARRADAVVVAADANNRAGEDFAPYPAGYEGVLAAAPMNRDLTVTVASRSGRPLALAVPGVDVVTTNTGGGYRIDSGATAAGVLAGAVALVRSAYPGLAADEILHRLTATAVDAGPPGRDEMYGFGQLDLVAALTRGVPPLHGPSTPPTPAPTKSPTAPPATAPAGNPRGPLGWLVVLPLLGVIGGLGWYAWRAEKAIR